MKNIPRSPSSCLAEPWLHSSSAPTLWTQLRTREQHSEMTVDCGANLRLQQISLSQTTANDLNYRSMQTCKKGKRQRRKTGCVLACVFFRPSLTCLTNARTHLAFLRGRDQSAEKEWLVRNDLSRSGKLGIRALWLAIISGFNLIHNHLAAAPTIACVRAPLCSWMYLSSYQHLTGVRCWKGRGEGATFPQSL